MSIAIKAIDQGFNDEDAQLVQIDVRYTGAAYAEQHNAPSVDPLLVFATAKTSATVDATLQEIADRSRRGESTPVTVSLVDALGLRDRLEELALRRFPE